MWAKLAIGWLGKRVKQHVKCRWYNMGRCVAACAPLCCISLIGTITQTRPCNEKEEKLFSLYTRRKMFQVDETKHRGRCAKHLDIHQVHRIACRGCGIQNSFWHEIHSIEERDGSYLNEIFFFRSSLSSSCLCAIDCCLSSALRSCGCQMNPQEHLHP